MCKKFCLVLCISLLSACGGSSEQKVQPPEPVLKTVADSYEGYWSRTLELDVLANDSYSATPTIEIVQAPSEGEVEVSNNQVVFRPPAAAVDTSFSYRLVTASATSAATEVSVKLRNGIKSVNVANDQHNLVEAIAYPITVELYLPDAAAELSVELQRANGQQQQLATLSAASDTTAFTWDYTPQGDLTNKSYLAASPETLVFSFADQQLELAYDYWDTPEPAELYNTIRSIWYNQRRSQEIITTRDFHLDWTSFPAWQIPQTPSWDEDPFNNNTWLLYYHSLAWLHAYEWEYQQTGNAELRAEIKRTIFDYLAASPRANPVNYMSWNDHSVAVRADVITYFYQQFMKQNMTAEERTWFASKMLDHADELRYLLDLDIYYAHNHSMFHAVSLLNIALTLPDQFVDNDYASAALTRIETLFSSMVVPETGFSREQATAYHFVAMELFMSASQFLERIQRDDSGSTKQRLNRMADAAAHLIYRKGGAPAMGDTNFNVDTYQRRLANIVNAGDLESSYFEYLQDASAGEPLQRAYHEQTEGIVILRPNSGTDVQTEQYALVDFGLPKISHGHHDAGHVTYAFDGHELLVDPGGPYLYQGRERVFFDTKLSHNLPIVNDQIRVTNAATTQIADCNASACWTLGKLTEATYAHVRLVFIPAANQAALSVFDLVKVNTPSGQDRIELNWHYAPQSQQPNCVALSEVSERCQIADDRVGQFTFQTIALQPLTRAIYEGFDDGQTQQGWVQPKFGMRTPAPVLSYTTQSSELTALTVLGQTASELQVTPLSNGYELKLPGHTVVIDSPWSETPVISVSAR